MLKKIFALLILIQGFLMSSTVETIEYKGKKIDLIFEQDSSLPIVYLKLVFFGAGHISDANQKGIAKFTARMLGEGTKSLGSVKFAQKLEEKAIRFSAVSGLETAVVDVSALKEEFENGVIAISDLFSEPNLSKNSFEKIRASLIASSIKKEDDFDHIADSLLKKNLFINTPLASDGLGSKDDIQKIKLADVEKFFRKYYGTSNVAIVAGGDVELATAKKYILKILNNLNNNEPYEYKTFNTTKITKEHSIKKETKQSFVYFGAPFNMTACDKDNYKAKVASFILGSSGFGSRIMEEIRVKNGLAYSVYTRHNVNKTSSYFSGYLQTKLENEEKAKELVKKVIVDFVQNGATQKELDGAKKFLLGSEPLRNETLAQRLSRSFNEYYLGVGIGNSEKELEQIKNLELADINNFVKSHPEIADLGFAVVNAGKQK